jgi:hypothetical protein
MARPKKPVDDKTESLKKYGALNPHPQKVVEKRFQIQRSNFSIPVILFRSSMRCCVPSKRKAVR